MYKIRTFFMTRINSLFAEVEILGIKEQHLKEFQNII